MIRMLIVGPPGCGKGTQSDVISKHFGVVPVSTGDIFRENVSRGTPLGLEAQKYIHAGEYVPDVITNKMIHHRLSQPDVLDGFLLDGYPRTVSQVHELDEILVQTGKKLDVVLEITADRDELVRRILKRAFEQNRVDDTEEIVNHRLDLFMQQTSMVLETYLQRGLLVKVDGIGEIVEVTARIMEALEAVSIVK